MTTKQTINRMETLIKNANKIETPDIMSVQLLLSAIAEGITEILKKITK